VHDSGVQSTGGTTKQINQWMEVMEVAPQAKSWVGKKHLDYLLADLLDGYVATMDCPAACLTPELLDLFPDALVIATTRDPKSWWRSMQVINTMTANWYLPFLVVWVPKIQSYGVWREKFKQLAMYRYGIDMFGPESLQMHEEHLRTVVPPEKLFWYEVKQGWEPLCKILNVPIPDRPFPHNNSIDDARKTYNELVTAGILTWMLVLTVVYIVFSFFYNHFHW
jgi:hypothetical protein